MVSALVKLFYKEIGGLHQAAYLLGLFALVSQLFALIRDRLLASMFGAGIELDIYYAAFRIPDFIFISVASVVSISVLIPFLVERRDLGYSEEKNFVDSIFSVFFILILFIAALAYVIAPFLLPIMFPGFTEADIKELIPLMRLLLLSPILLGLSNLFASITQVYKRFFIYALSPVLYNIGIIFGVIFWAPKFGIKGVVYGVILGAFFHLAIQVPFIANQKLIPRFRRAVDWVIVRNVFLLSLPRTLTLGMNHIVIIFLLSIASLMSDGSISVFNFSYNLQSVPLSIIGVSYSLAAFPALSELYRRSDIEEFISKIKTAARHIIFWSIPITVLFVVLRAQVVRVILGSGEFTWSDTRLTAAALALFALSVVFQSLVVLFVRGFYAAGNTLTPLVVNVFSGIVTIASGYFLFNLFSSSIDTRIFFSDILRVSSTEASIVLALPLAFTLGSFLNGILLWLTFSRQFPEFTLELSRPFRESTIASFAIGLASYNLLNLLDEAFDLNTLPGIFSQGFIAGIGGILVGILLFILLGNKELLEVYRALRRKFWKAKVVPPDADVIG